MLHLIVPTVHFCWFIFFTMFCGMWISILDKVPYIDAWFSAVAAMTGGSLMPYDVSNLSRGSEVVLWFAMTFGGITLLSGIPGLWRMYLYRKQLRPLIYNIDELRDRLAADGVDLSVPEIKSWLGDNAFYKVRTHSALWPRPARASVYPPAHIPPLTASAPSTRRPPRRISSKSSTSRTAPSA